MAPLRQQVTEKEKLAGTNLRIRNLLQFSENRYLMAVLCNVKACICSRTQSPSF